MVDNLSDNSGLLHGTPEVLIFRSLRLGPNHAYGVAQFPKLQSEQEFIVDNGSLYPAFSDYCSESEFGQNGKSRLRVVELNTTGSLHPAEKQLVVATSKWQRLVKATARILVPES